MSFSPSWVAVQGLAPDKALATLGMEVAEVVEPRDIPNWRDIVVMGNFREDWLLVLSADPEDAFDGFLAQLTTLGPAIACSSSENVMVSEARGYAAGEEVWRVLHDPEEEESLYALEISGTPPPELDAIVHHARAQQDEAGGEDANVDLIFDITNSLSKLICGYMPGDDEPEGFHYSVLEPIGGKVSPPAGGETGLRPGFFARLFGRG